MASPSSTRVVKSPQPAGIKDPVKEKFYDNYAKDIEPKDRSLWCLDQSRIKYLVRDSNDWKIDINGKKIKEAVIPVIKDKLFEGTTFLNWYKLWRTRITKNKKPLYSLGKLRHLKIHPLYSPRKK